MIYSRRIHEHLKKKFIIVQYNVVQRLLPPTNPIEWKSFQLFLKRNRYLLPKISTSSSFNFTSSRSMFFGFMTDNSNFMSTFFPFLLRFHFIINFCFIQDKSSVAFVTTFFVTTCILVFIFFFIILLENKREILRQVAIEIYGKNEVSPITSSSEFSSSSSLPGATSYSKKKSNTA